MATPLPKSLSEVSRFIFRANQLRTIKPAIAYWCEYHALQHILKNDLHTANDEAHEYTTTLLDRLEATKAERADDDAIVDDTAAQAYVEQFAHDAFTRAERTLRANKVTRQTADTFAAAATFFDVTEVWGDLDPEIVQKSKFAKWNAARILKAINEGKDPNDSNPNRPEPEATPTLDPSDPDVQVLSAPGPQPAFVEDVPDAGEPASLPRFVDEPPRPPPNQQGYFPEDQGDPEPFVPSPLSQSSTPGVSGMPPPPLPPLNPSPAPAPTMPPPHQPSPHIHSQLPPQFTPPPPSPSVASSAPPPTWVAPHIPPTAASHAPPAHHAPPFAPQPSVPPYQHPPVHSYQQPPPPAPAPVPVPAPAPAPAPNWGHAPNQKDINQAQKHAKWAISALNFDDVPTAVKELRNALALLGAQ